MPFASSIDDGRQPRKATDAVPGLAAGAHRQIDHELAVERHVATHWIGLPWNHDPSVIRGASVSITITWNSLDRLRWRIAIVGAFRAAMWWMRDLYCRGSIKLWWICYYRSANRNSASPTIGTASVGESRWGLRRSRLSGTRRFGCTPDGRLG